MHTADQSGITQYDGTLKYTEKTVQILRTISNEAIIEQRFKDTANSGTLGE